MVFEKVVNFINAEKYSENPSFGPSLKLLTLLYFRPNASPQLNIYRKFWARFFFMCYLTNITSMSIELWFLRGDQEIFQGISMVLLALISATKLSNFIYYGPVWEECIQAMSNWELMQLQENAIIRNKVKKYIKYTRITFTIYTSLSVITGVFLSGSSFVKYFASSPEYRDAVKNGDESYPQIYHEWYPFDKNKPLGYITATTIAIISSNFGALFILSYDTLFASIMNFFTGQLNILKYNCSTIFGSPNDDISVSEVMKRIEKCHKHHEFILKYFRKFDSLTSPIMFIYVLVCSCMICAGVVQLIVSDKETIILVIEYVCALVSQLFLYCWHSNETFEASEFVHQGIYESFWWKSKYHRYFGRDVILLCGKLKATLVFSAGPFTTLSMATFVSIMKGAYSVYAIFRG